MSTKTCCTGQGPCSVCGGSTKRYVRSQFDDDYDPKLPDGYMPMTMTTPDPITTAREALTRLAHDEYVKSEDRRIVTAALDYAEKLKAQNIALTQNVKDLDQVICDTAEEIGCVPDNEVMLEAIDAIKTERDALTSQLEQAERVIIEYFSAKNAFDGLVGRGPVQDDEIETIRLNWVAAQRSASQWIKDRQAKGEG